MAVRCIQRMPPILNPGATLGRFQIAHCLGRGGMGAVYRAHDTRLGRDVALKLMLPEFTETDPTAGLRFLREAEVAAKVRHPNIVCVFDLGILNEIPYIVMECMEGSDLGHHLATQGTLGVAEAADVLLPICSAMGAAHRANVVHRDLKPSNIFLARSSEERSVPMVLDFGLAHPTLVNTVLDPISGLAGTPQYFSPEVLFGEGDIGPAVDIYALGAILYELVVGRTAFGHIRDVPTLLERLRSEPFPRLRDAWPAAPEPLVNIVRKATRALPVSRYSSAASLGRALLPLASRDVQYLYEREFLQKPAARRSPTSYV